MAADLPTVVIHADDIGMSHSANVAFLELFRLGTITSGSVMVPCPWFPEIADAAAQDLTLDLGVHLTLCAEQRPYRWRPVSAATGASGLVDDDGYLWADVTSVRRHAHPEAVETEWRAQIDRALAAGIDVTHLDAHMGAALAPEFRERYVQVGADYGVPVLVTATLDGYSPRSPHLADVTDDQHHPFVEQARALGHPLFDRVVETDFSRPTDVAPDYRTVFRSFQQGLSFCAFHPATPGDIQSIEPGSCHVRTDEYALFRTDEWRHWLMQQPLHLMGMRELRDAR